MAGSNVPSYKVEEFQLEVYEVFLAIMAAGISYDRIILGIKEEYSYRDDCHVLIGDLSIKREAIHGYKNQ